MFVEYVMLAGVNDSLDHARGLAELLDPKIFKVNLIPYNPTGMFDGSSRRDDGRVQGCIAQVGLLPDAATHPRA